MSLGDPRVRPVLLLSALVTLLTVETLRAAGPLLTNVSREGSALAAVLVTLIVFALPAVTGPLTRWLNPTRATAAAVAALVLLRLLLQLQSTPGFLLTTLTTATALTALLLTTHHTTTVRSAAGGGIVAATGLLLGTALDAASRTAFASWDPLWRPGLLPWLYTIALAVLTLLALARTTRQAAIHAPATAPPPRRPSPTPRPATRASGRASAGSVAVPVWPVVRLGVVGLFLALDLMVFGSPAFVSSRSGIGLPYAGALLLLGLLLAIEAVSRSHLPGGSARLPELSGRRAGLPAAVVLVAAVAVAVFLTGPLMVIAILVAQVAGALVLARALEPSAGTTATGSQVARSRAGGAVVGGPRGAAVPVGLVVAGAAMGLVVALVVVGYQALVAVGLDGRWVLVAGAVVAGVVSLGRRAGADVDAVASVDGEDSVVRRRGKRGRWAVVAGVPAVLLVVPVVVLVTAGAAGEQGGAADSVRVVSWDVDGAVGDGGAVDAGQVAEVLGRERADVVLLQDVGRGAVGSGGVDLVEYLGRALGMGYVWAPAGDGRTGTVVLARLPMSGARVGSVADRVGGSYAAVTVETTSGQRLRVVSAALGNGPDRSAGMRALLGVWGRRHPAVIGGALGAGPGSPEVAAAQDAGLASAQDSAGQSGMATTPAGHPTQRPDWIFGTPDVSFGDFAVPGTTASNHRPLSVTARLG
jgi:endonuclease/exonuclease/phosphatase family metal-dependent hydrolase